MKMRSFNKNIGLFLLAWFIAWSMVILFLPALSGLGLALVSILAVTVVIFIILDRQVNCHSTNESGGIQ